MVRILQWNILSDGLCNDGFLSTEFQAIRESSEPNARSYSPTEFISMVREAKEADRESGAWNYLKILRKEGEELKMSPQNYFDTAERMKVKEKMERLKLKAHATQSELEKLKNKFQYSPDFEKISSTVLSWDARYKRIKDIILAADPDVLTFQEMDHLQQFIEDEDLNSKYTCLIEDVCYQPAKYDTKDSNNDDLRHENYLRHVLNSRAAFAPKSYSKASSYRRSRQQDSNKVDNIDDDGVAIFWKKEKYQAVELGFLKVPESAGKRGTAVVAIALEHRERNERINVLTAHLPSGDTTKKELERLGVLCDPNGEWTARRSRLDTDSNEWREDSYGERNFDGVLSFVHHYAQRKNCTTIFALDANSRPSFPLVKLSEDKPEATNVWNEIKKIGLECIWQQTECIQEDGRAKNQDYPYLVSVNKMRGPASDQIEKIGEHKLELIDHIFTNGPRSELLNEVEVNGEIIPMAPLRYKQTVGEAELALIPSSKMPSDHLPVLLDISLRS